jgi:hypothetical protein
MNRVRALANSTHGDARFVPFTHLWGTAALLADTLPLERPSDYPRPLRQVGHCIRLTLWDRALTNRDGTAVLTVSRTRWVVAGGAAIAAAIISPKLPRWPRRMLIATAATFAVRKRRLRHYIAFQRQLHRVAPGGLIIGVLVAREPGSAVTWIRDVFAALDATDNQTTFIAILPGARRDRARERLYTMVFNFQVAARNAGDGQLTILVRPAGSSGARAH